jgi:hypothetical protein
MPYISKLNLNGTEYDLRASGGGSATTILSETLSAGSTSVTFSNVTVTSGSIIEVGTSVPGLEYVNLTVNGSSYTVTFNAQSEAITVYLVITEVS